MRIVELPETDGGGNISLVYLTRTPGGGLLLRRTPHCALHGAMNKVSPDGIWRCITTTSATAGKRCNAGCLEVAP